MPSLLVVDTSGTIAALEAWRGHQLAGSEHLGTTGHARLLAGGIKRLLATVNWQLPEIDAIAINLGPGSFTGIRVGLALVKALVFVHGQPLIGIDNFDAWAAGLSAEGPNFVDVAMPGQLGTVDVIRYEEGQRGHVRTMSRHQFVNERNANVFVVSPSTGLLQLLPTQQLLADVMPQMAVAAKTRLARCQFDDPMVVEPFYVRPCSAEEKWDARLASSH